MIIPRKVYNEAPEKTEVSKRKKKQRKSDSF